MALLPFCGTCRASDPTEALRGRGIEVEWDLRFGRLSAGMGIPGRDPDLRVQCVPYLWYHRLWGLVSPRLLLGEAAFDDRILVRAPSPEGARDVLGAGARCAVLALLTRVHVNELVGNHVTLAGPTLTLSTRPLGEQTPSRVLELQLEATALALHLAGPPPVPR